MADGEALHEAVDQLHLVIVQRDLAEGRGIGERALALGLDIVAAGAVDLGEALALGDLLGLVLSQRRGCGEHHAEEGENRFHHSAFILT